VNALEATDYLRRKMQEDADVKSMVTSICARGGFADLFEWAEAEPDEVILVAESVTDMLSQVEEFDRRLASGDLS
jgi:hypothetical protein